MTKKEYNNEPIYFCSECLSPAVVFDESEDRDVCKDCGGINITRASLEVWEEKFGNVYGVSYLCIPNKEFKKMITWL